MASNQLLFAVLVVQFIISGALHLPSYIVPCAKNDPDLANCITDHANAAIPHLIKGDKKYNFPPLNPLKLSEIKIDVAQNFKLKLTDVSVYGFETAKISDTTFDFEKFQSDGHITMDYLSFVGNYEIDGRILMLPIVGSGAANITFVKPKLHVVEISGTEIRDGVEYMTMKKVRVTYDIEGAHYDIDNLFNGDKALGDQMNQLLNENWEALHKEFSPSIIAVAEEILLRIAQNIVKMVPLKYIFV